MRWRRYIVAAFVCSLGCGAFAAGASASSILYKKGGKLWAASPSGTHRHAIKHTKGLANPSQDDRGRIVAQKGIKLYRLSRSGKRLNKLITTAFRTNPVVTSFKGRSSRRSRRTGS